MGFGKPIFIALSVLVPVLSAGLLKPCQSKDLSPDEISCTNFYYCKNGTKVPAHCPIGKYFDPGLKACVTDHEKPSKCEVDTVIIEILRLRAPTTTKGPISRFIPMLKSIPKTYLMPKLKTTTSASNISSTATIFTTEANTLLVPKNYTSKYVFVTRTTSKPRNMKRSDFTSLYSDLDDLKLDSFEENVTNNMTKAHGIKSTSPFTSLSKTFATTSRPLTTNSLQLAGSPEILSDLNSDLNLDFQYANPDKYKTNFSEQNTTIKPTLSSYSPKTRQTRNRKTSTTPQTAFFTNITSVTAAPKMIKDYLTTRYPQLNDKYTDLVAELSLHKDLDPDSNNYLDPKYSKEHVASKHRSNKYNSVISFQSTLSPKQSYKARTIRTLNFVEAYSNRDYDYQYPFGVKEMVTKKITQTKFVKVTTPKTGSITHYPKLRPTADLKHTAFVERTTITPKFTKHSRTMGEYPDLQFDGFGNQDVKYVSKSLKSHQKEGNKDTSYSNKKRRTTTTPKIFTTAKSTFKSNKIPTYMNMYSDTVYMDTTMGSKLSNPKETTVSFKTTSKPKRTTTVGPKNTSTRPPVPTTKRSSYMDMYSDLSDLAPNKDMKYRHLKNLNSEDTTARSSSNSRHRTSFATRRKFTTAFKPTVKPATKTTKRSYFMNMYEEISDLSSFRELDREFYAKFSKKDKTTLRPKFSLTTNKTPPTTDRIMTSPRSAMAQTRMSPYLNMYSDLLYTNTDRDLYPKYSKFLDQDEDTSNRPRTSTYSSRFSFPNKPVEKVTPKLVIRSTTFRNAKRPKLPANLYSDMDSYSTMHQETNLDLDRILEEKELDVLFNDNNALENNSY